MLSYSDIQNKIADCERVRLQKLLHIILPKEKSALALRCFLKESYARLGLSITELKTQGLWPSFAKLLNSYGFLVRSSLDSDEQKQLQANPYTIWPSKDYCVLNADALDFLASEPSLKKENYLCFSLQKLRAREKKDWCKCLGLNTAVSSERERTLVLYRHLAHLNCQKQTMAEKNMNLTKPNEEAALRQLPEFLDEVFPDNPALSPLAWFYRDVISFYRALGEAEKKMQEYSPLAQALFPLFKSGRLIILAAPPEASKALRWRILRTKEEAPSFIQADHFSSFLDLHVRFHSEQKKEGMLF